MTDVISAMFIFLPGMRARTGARAGSRAGSPENVSAAARGTPIPDFYELKNGRCIFSTEKCTLPSHRLSHIVNDSLLLHIILIILYDSYMNMVYNVDYACNESLLNQY